MSDPIPPSSGPYLTAAALQKHARRQGKDIADQIVEAEREHHFDAGHPAELAPGDRISLRDLKNIVAQGGYLKGTADDDGHVTLYASPNPRSGLGMSFIGKALRYIFGEAQSAQKQNLAKAALESALAQDYGAGIARAVVQNIDEERAATGRDYFTFGLIQKADGMAQALHRGTPGRVGEDFVEQQGLDAVLDAMWSDDLILDLGPKDQVLAGDSDRQAAVAAIGQAFEDLPGDVAALSDQQKLVLATEALTDHLRGQTARASDKVPRDNLNEGKSFLEDHGLEAVAMAVSDDVGAKDLGLSDKAVRKQAENAILLAFAGDKRNIAALTEQQKFDLAADALEAHLARQADVAGN